MFIKKVSLLIIFIFPSLIFAKDSLNVRFVGGYPFGQFWYFPAAYMSTQSAPEILELWISETFYADSVIEVIFERDDGDFASVGPIYVYQYEYEEGEGGAGGGPMAQQSQPLNTTSLILFPNPFSQTINIKYQTQAEKEINVKVYDVVGRLVRRLYRGVVNGNRALTWDGADDNGREISQGVYFIHVENYNAGEISCRKVLKIE